MSDTIAAIATGGGISAIGVIRLSGPDAIAIANSVFRPRAGGELSYAPARKLILGRCVDAEGAVIDECLCTVSRAPESYTGEDTAEFQCHGSPIVLSEVLRALFQNGARQAGPGEFTKRAFLNGRMDLSQAEAVIDLIEAETAAAARNAAGQLGGTIRDRAEAAYSRMLDILAHFHAVLDYPDEDIDDFALGEYIETVDAVWGELHALLATFERGQLLKDGVAVTIAGRPNVGKSSLLNALLGYDRAIVTDIAGTTRDTIEEKVRLGNLLLRLTDTAGLRETEEAVEKIGTERARLAVHSAQLVLAVFDGSMPLTEEDRAVLRAVSGSEKVIAVMNKSDLPPALELAEITARADAVIPVSAKTGEGLSALEAAVKVLFDLGPPPRGETLTNARQADAARRALEALEHAKSAMTQGVTPDAALTGIEDALGAIGEITGRTMRGDVTARIFERFCVGK